jgi:hypothetical protein
MKDFFTPPYSREAVFALRLIWVLGLSMSLDSADTFQGAPWETGASAADRFVLHPKAHRFHPKNQAAEITKPAFELAFVLGVPEQECLRLLDRLRAEDLVVDWGECNFVLSQKGESLFAQQRGRFLSTFGQDFFTAENPR